jgi:hypothetical protein
MAITRAQQVRQMLKDGNFVMQGGVKNYLGEQETVNNVPVKWQSGPDKPSTELAYITKAEKDLLLKKDIHGSLKDGPNMGPGGLMSLDSAGSGFGGPGPGKSSSSGGGNDRNDPPSDFRSSNVMNPTTKTAREKFERTGERVKSLTDTGGFTGGAGGSGGANDPDDKPVKDLIDFYNKPANYPKYTPAYVKFLGNLNRKPNRKFFVERVLRAGKIPNLPSNVLDVYGEDFDLEAAYQDYMDNRMAGKTDAMGNPVTGFEYGDDGTLTGNFIDDRDDGANQPIIPQTPGDSDDSDDEDNTNTGGLALRFMSRGGSLMDAPTTGGIMDLETGRQMYFLGKLVKKATRAVKKIVKSPIGKAAILGGAMYFGSGAGAGKLGSFFGKGSFNPFLKKVAGDQAFSGLGAILNKAGLVNLSGGLTGKGMFSAGALALTPLLFGQQEDDEEEEFYRGPGLDIPYIRGNPYTFRSRIGDGTGLMTRAFQDGGSTEKEPVAKKTMPLLDMDGKEMDLREDGGFVPIGRMEKADDVPARLSKNEFVFTADAVRNAGEGDVDKGAEVMYNMMKNLESGGEVSEESQGLEGAREMFQTSKRLEEVL